MHNVFQFLHFPVNNQNVKMSSAFYCCFPNQSRQLLADNLQKGHQLLAKRVEVTASDGEDETVVSSSDEGELETTLVVEVESSSSDNPWMTSGTPKAPGTLKAKKDQPSSREQCKGSALVLSDTKEDEEQEGLQSNDGNSNEESGKESEQDGGEDEEDDEERSSQENGDFGLTTDFVEPPWPGNNDDDDNGGTSEAVVTTHTSLLHAKAPSTGDTSHTVDALRLQIDTSKVLSVDETLNTETRKSADQQRVVIAEAFASDDVVGEFAAAKAEDMKETAPKVVDLTLRGWGSWAGDGAPHPRKPQARIVKHSDRNESRADQKLAHVIISQKVNKKLAEHQVS